MWTPSLLIIIATIAGLITLWRDEIVAVKLPISSTETDEEKSKRLSEELKQEKTKKVKLISSIFILLTLIFTIYQINLSDIASDKANFERTQQHKEDSTRYAKDSIKHILERKQDSLDHVLIDSIHTLQLHVDSIQLHADSIQLVAGKSIDSIKIKSASITRNLSGIDTAIKMSIAKIDKSSRFAQQSFNHVFSESQRMMNLLDSDITADIRIPIWADTIVNSMEHYIKQKGFTGDDIDVTEEFPFWKDIMDFVEDMDITIDFFTKPNAKWKTSEYLASHILLPSSQLRLSNYSAQFIPGDENNNKKRSGWGLTYHGQEKYDGIFRVEYYRPNKNLAFVVKDLRLSTEWRDPTALSILDYDSSKVWVMIRFQPIRKDKTIFSLEKCNLSIGLIFREKGLAQIYTSNL